MSIKDAAMKALESSLQQTVERSQQLENQLNASNAELLATRAASTTTRASLDTRTAEVAELRAALAERDAQLGQLRNATDESEAQRKQAQQRVVRLRAAGQELIGSLGAAVLTAQEASAKPRPLEQNLLKVPAGAERDSVAQLQANFQAVFEAYSTTLAELESLTASVVELGPSMGALRDALNVRPDEGAPAPSATDSAKLAELERAWKERCAANRDVGGSGVQSTGAAGETFEVVVPADASPGDILTLTTQTGQRMKVVVPEGAEPGDTLTLAMTTQ